MPKSSKREGQCDAECIDDDTDSMAFCVLDSYHPGLRHKTSDGSFFGAVMSYSAEKDVEILQKLHRDIVTHGIDVGQLMGFEKGELQKLVKSARTPKLPVQLPPWVVFHHGDNKTASILPAGRPGNVLENLPLSLAHAITKTANRWKP